MVKKLKALFNKMNKALFPTQTYFYCNRTDNLISFNFAMDAHDRVCYAFYCPDHK